MNQDRVNKIVLAVIVIAISALFFTMIYQFLMALLLAGLFSALARQCVIRALAEGEASIVMPFNFLKLPFTVCLGLVFFAQRPDLWTGVGAAVIFASSYYIARREAVLKAQSSVKPPPV